MIGKLKERGILDFLYPARCPVCDGVLLHEEEVCEECLPKLRYVAEPRCCKCGKPLRIEEEEYCHDCMDGRHIYDSGLALYEYDSIKDSLYRFKYKGRCEYAGFYGKEIAERLGDRIMKWYPDVLLPVPMYKRKERMRGYNQAGLLAEAVGAALHIPVGRNLMIRQRQTVPMKELDPAGRQINLKNAFNIGQFDVKLKSIIIIDDIYTTGSTMDEMAKVLKTAGVSRIHFLTLAIGRL
ncbi:MAG: double zinc ribbon domain-containing protein [Lachnospiraceae bacterium]|nr:double zinc ribbon domain-containing protein [Lachnospiraceae bacterium]